MTIADVARLLMPIKAKIMSIVSRASLEEVDGSTTTQTVKVGVRKDEVLEGRERLQEFGFDSYPTPGGDAEALVLCPNGTREISLIIKAFNRTLRPTDLDEGESMMYGEDSAGGITNYIKISPTGNTITISTSDGNTVTIDENGIILSDTNGNDITMETSKISFNGGNVEILQ